MGYMCVLTKVDSLNLVHLSRKMDKIKYLVGFTFFVSTPLSLISIMIVFSK